MIVVDTNVLSEIIRPAPSPQVRDWLADRRQSILTTAITIGELAYGVALLPDGDKRRKLESGLNQVQDLVSDRILPYDADAATILGRIRASQERRGRTVGIEDLMIAAVCIRHGAAVATRNTRHFDGMGLTVINPWE